MPSHNSRLWHNAFKWESWAHTSLKIKQLTVISVARYIAPSILCTFPKGFYAGIFLILSSFCQDPSTSSNKEIFECPPWPNQLGLSYWNNPVSSIISWAVWPACIRIPWVGLYGHGWVSGVIANLTQPIQWYPMILLNTIISSLLQVYIWSFSLGLKVRFVTSEDMNLFILHMYRQ